MPRLGEQLSQWGPKSAEAKRPGAGLWEEAHSSYNTHRWKQYGQRYGGKELKDHPYILARALGLSEQQ